MTEIAQSEPLAISALTIFGPVPSRRLGQSLGIGNVPPKTCSYSCVYWQVGPTPATEIEPRTFWSPDTVIEAARRHVDKLRAHDEGAARRQSTRARLGYPHERSVRAGAHPDRRRRL